MTTNQIKAMHDKVMATQEKVYNTKVYRYWLNGNDELCRAKRNELGTVECKIEVLATPVKAYHIKPEYLHLWGNEATEETVIYERELQWLSSEWGISAGDLLEQLVEICPV